MSTVNEQIRDADDVIVRNIAVLADQRDLLSQNVLSQLRNLVEGLIVLAHHGDGDAIFRQSDVGEALDYVRADARLNVLSRFHHRLQGSTSHYTLAGDPSERLMLKYFEYLVRIRDLAETRLSRAILGNLDQFPLETDESLREYYEQIAARVAQLLDGHSGASDVYYVHSSRPFFVGGRIFYEVTFSVAHNRTNKFDRHIGFTDIDITDKYAARLDIVQDSIDVLGQSMPIALIRGWSVAIRGCEFDNLRKLLFGPHNERVRPGQREYQNLMRYLTETRSNLLDLVDMQDAKYQQIRTWVLADVERTPLIVPLLDEARRIIRGSAAGGKSLLRFLLLRMYNNLIRDQYARDRCWPLAGMWVTHSSRPFDTMPFCTSPYKHKASFGDLAEALDSSTRRHEILARRIQSNVEVDGRIYTKGADLEGFGDLDALVRRHNSLLPPNNPRHAPRALVHANGHVFIKGYEDDTVEIVGKLQDIAATGVAGYTEGVEDWLDDNPAEVDDPLKAEALKALFTHSKVALVYGAAGTGKSRMVDHIAKHFEYERKLFLAHTNPAVENLRNNIRSVNSEFSTIHGHLRNRTIGGHYDLLVIDECSTVSNASLLEVLRVSTFDLLVLVGDVYQIEAIEFGNWFTSIRSYLPTTSVFELRTPWRTKNPALLTLWDRVRNLDDRIEESLSTGPYSAVLGDALFRSRQEDEIVLCINYDGVYGINNVNRFLQTSNPNPAVVRRGATFKVGDPVLFSDTDRFRGVIYNNLKGVLVAVTPSIGKVTFDVELAREIDSLDVWGTDLTLVGDSTVRFDVLDMVDPDDDDDTSVTVVPFQIAYAVSFHKAQGLEYDSVKVVITDVNESRVSHAMFYTAITRARRDLEVYWTPQTQARILDRLTPRDITTDESILQQRRGLVPVTRRPRMPRPRTAP